MSTTHFIHSSFINIHFSYLILFIGQIFAAIAQPIFTNSPARIPAVWFPPEGRAGRHCPGAAGGADLAADGGGRGDARRTDARHERGGPAAVADD